MDDMKQKFSDGKKLHNEKFEQGSKKRLMANVEKKFRTTMIGSLASFEKEFGHLWGHDQRGELTEEQAAAFEAWQQVRAEILNNGNGQSRACLDEISQYTMTWNRFTTQFIVKPKEPGE